MIETQRSCTLVGVHGDVVRRLLIHRGNKIDHRAHIVREAQRAALEWHLDELRRYPNFVKMRFRLVEVFLIEHMHADRLAGRLRGGLLYCETVVLALLNATQPKRIGFLVGEDQTDHLSVRVDALVVASDRSTRLHEKEYRAMLRMSLEHAPRSEQLLPLRTAFRREALTQALAPVQKELGAKRVERLVGALCMVVGIEALIATKEVARLAPDTALGVKRWAAGALLAAALDEARRGKQKGPKRNLRRNGSALHARSLKIIR
jgi:hypothetical protein